MTTLKGKSILVTRPGRQGKALSTEIIYRGGRSILCPMIQIGEPADIEIAREVAKNIENYDLAVFISRNAVHYGLKTLADVGKELPQMDVYAVGPGTALELKLAGIERVYFPDLSHSSDGLLRLDSFQADSLDGRRVVVFRGEGGRELLASSLADRGAEVSYCECYQRQPPCINLREQLQTAQIFTPDIGLATSLESLNNLARIIIQNEMTNLFNMQMLVVSNRLSLHLRNLGFSLPALVSADSSNESLLDQITRWVQNQG